MSHSHPKGIESRSDSVNRALLMKFTVIAVAMFAFGFALVPLYDQLCRAIGLRELGGRDDVENTQVDATRTVRVELDANVSGLPWQFRPGTPLINVHPGELTSLVYEVANETDLRITGQAVPSYAPALAGQYFRKLECFCFTRQSLAAHEKRAMPIVFVIDPKLPRDVATITLSYTFFEVEGSGS